MQKYANLSGESNVEGYITGNDFIIVKFASNKYSGAMYYKYTAQASGDQAIEHMKALAVKGSGLNSYINTTAVKKQFVSKNSSLEGL